MFIETHSELGQMGHVINKCSAQQTSSPSGMSSTTSSSSGAIRFSAAIFCRNRSGAFNCAHMCMEQVALHSGCHWVQERGLLWQGCWLALSRVAGTAHAQSQGAPYRSKSATGTKGGSMQSAGPEAPSHTLRARANLRSHANSGPYAGKPAGSEVSWDLSPSPPLSEGRGCSYEGGGTPPPTTSSSMDQALH